MGAGWVPRWLAPVCAIWFIIGVVTVAQVSSIPVHGAMMVAGCGLLALGHGLVHRRWLVAGPIAVLATALVGAWVSGLLPDGFQLGPYVGPAQSATPKVIWTTLFVVVGADLALATALRRRVWRATVGRPPATVAPSHRDR